MVIDQSRNYCATWRLLFEIVKNAVNGRQLAIGHESWILYFRLGEDEP